MKNLLLILISLIPINITAKEKADPIIVKVAIV